MWTLWSMVLYQMSIISLLIVYRCVCCSLLAWIYRENHQLMLAVTAIAFLMQFPWQGHENLSCEIRVKTRCLKTSLYMKETTKNQRKLRNNTKTSDPIWQTFYIRKHWSEERFMDMVILSWRPLSADIPSKPVTSVNPFLHTAILQQTTLNVFCQNIENLYWMDNLWSGKYCVKRSHSS